MNSYIIKEIEKLNIKLKEHKKFKKAVNDLLYTINKYDDTTDKDVEISFKMYDNGKYLKAFFDGEKKKHKRFFKEVEIYLQDENLQIEESMGIFEKGMLSLEYITKLYDENGIELSRNIFSDYLNIPNCYSVKEELNNFKPIIDGEELSLPKFANHAKVISINRDYDDWGLAVVTTVDDLTVLNNKSKYSNRKREILETIPKYADVLYTKGPIYAEYDFLKDEYKFNDKITKAKNLKELKEEHNPYFINRLHYEKFDVNNKEAYDLIVNKSESKSIKK